MAGGSSCVIEVRTALGMGPVALLGGNGAAPQVRARESLSGGV
jgi:hypothetical protein